MNSIESKITQVLAAREGGSVRRGHAAPSVPESYTVGAHSYGALSILLLVHPSPTMRLIRAVLWHDAAERWLGDMPSIAKVENADLKRVYEAIESRMLSQLGFVSIDLTEDEKQWLAGVDTMECWLFAREQRRIGNRDMLPWEQACESSLENRFAKGELPHPLWELFAAIGEEGPRRLSDFFERDVAHGLGTPGD